MKPVRIFRILLFLTIVSCKPIKYADLEEGMYADFQTEKGDILLKLEYEKVPLTVSNFVSLAEGTNTIVTDSLKKQPFYNGIVFHRVINDFMIQGGDPTGTGSGDPGYKFADEFPKDDDGNLLLKHDQAGILSMANSGPATNGSQFFITHKATPWLDGKHTVFGSVVLGQDVVDSITKNDVLEKVKIIKIGKSAKRFDAAKVFETSYQKWASVLNGILDQMKEFEPKATELESGLKIYITETRNGESPGLGSEVKVHYAGYFSNGRLFDTSYKDIASAYGVYDKKRDDANGYQPIKTVYGPGAKLIQGFREGLQQMKIGDKAILFIPPHLGYGAQGAGNVIPPNSKLIFQLELVE